MDGKEIFANLKKAFEEAVEFTVQNGMHAGGIEANEIRRSELLRAVANEASHRLENRPYQDGIANVVTGRKKYKEY